MLVVAGEFIVKSENRKNTQNSLYLGLGLANIIAIPFPIYPRRVRHGQIAKILDFSAWKSCHKSEVDDSTNETLEQIMKLSIAEQKIWVIRRLLEIYDCGDRGDLRKICEILYGEVPDGA
jgi:hypothetical protein